MLSEIIEFVTDPVKMLAIVGGAAAVSRGLLEIAKVTPWGWDDRWFGKIYAVLQRISGAVSLQPKK